jgi:crotonobetainyl-CoA:carnitine CoA-transferase CaiB-like acyl-CoA transferase
MSINRGRDGIPHKTDTTIIDAVTGMYAFQAVSMALWPGTAREARHLDVSLMQSAAAVLGPKVLEAAYLGQPPQAINPPAGSYATSDGWVAVTLVRETQFHALAREIGEPGLPSDPRFDSFASRPLRRADNRRMGGPVDRGGCPGQPRQRIHRLAG